MEDTENEINSLNDITDNMRNAGNAANWDYLPSGQIATYFYFQLENGIGNAGRLIVLNIFFLVFEIVITMTLMRDFAILIGGEPKVFGLSKLV